MNQEVKETKKEARIPKPFGSYVIVKPRPLEYMSSGGIVIPRLNEERDQGSVTDGTVVAIGPIAFKDELNPSGEPWYQVGDRVIFVKYGGKFITYDKQLYIIFRYEDIMCQIEADIEFKDGEQE